MDQNYSNGYMLVKNNVVYFENKQLQIALLKGKDSLDFINRISTNEVLSLKVSESIQTVLTSEKGRIIDVVTLLSLGNNEVLLVSSNNSLESTIRWIKKYVIMDDVSVKQINTYTAFELHGPRSTDFANELFSLENYDFSFQNFSKHHESGSLVFRIPSISEISLLLLIPTAQLDSEDNLSMKKIIENSITFISEFDRELLRIHAGLGKSPNELNENYNPLEAGLLHIINFKKGCYIGQEVIARLDSYNKVKQRIFGITSTVQINELDSIFVDSKEVGKVTSILKVNENCYDGLCYIRGEFAQNNLSVTVENENSKIEATLKQIPFENE